MDMFCVFYITQNSDGTFERHEKWFNNFEKARNFGERVDDTFIIFDGGFNKDGELCIINIYYLQGVIK